MNISVAMCTFNGERYLSEQLESIATQTLQPSELIICDDCSSDATDQIVKAFTSKVSFPVKFVRNQANIGCTKNFEQAIQLCTGDFIALSDQDDIWYPNKLGTLYSALESDPFIGGVFSDGDIIGSKIQVNGTLWNSFGFDTNKQKLFNSGHALNVFLRANRVTGMTLMFRATLRELLLPIPATWTHDGWLAWMLIIYSKLSACPSRLVAYRVHESQQLGVPTSLKEVFNLPYYEIFAYLNKIKLRTLDECHNLTVQFADLATVIERNNDSQKKFFAFAHEKSRFSQSRYAILSCSRLLRPWKLIFCIREYCKYSPNTVKSIITDLIM